MGTPGQPGHSHLLPPSLLFPSLLGMLQVSWDGHSTAAERGVHGDSYLSFPPKATETNLYHLHCLSKHIYKGSPVCLFLLLQSSCIVQGSETVQEQAIKSRVLSF